MHNEKKAGGNLQESPVIASTGRHRANLMQIASFNGDYLCTFFLARSGSLHTTLVIASAARSAQRGNPRKHLHGWKIVTAHSLALLKKEETAVKKGWTALVSPDLIRGLAQRDGTTGVVAASFRGHYDLPLFP